MADLHESHSYSYKALACRVCGATYPRHLDLLYAECVDVDWRTFEDRLSHGLKAVGINRRLSEDASHETES